jgi:hypothetical protein
VRATICYEGEADKMSDIVVTETLSQTVERQAREIERLRAALRSSCDEQRQLFRDEANLPCEAAIENQVMRDLLSEALDKPFTLGRQSTIDAWQCDWSRRVREALGDGVRQSNKSHT